MVNYIKFGMLAVLSTTEGKEEEGVSHTVFFLQYYYFDTNIDILKGFK